MDTLTPRQRSKRMSLVLGKNTKPEMAVRRLVHGMGYRYRLHGKDLPGRPDLVFRKRKKVIFIHGCFWHRHENCKLARLPKSRHDFWIPKLEGNKNRDEKNQAELMDLGWSVMVIWECEIKECPTLSKRIRAFLDDGENAA